MATFAVLAVLAAACGDPSAIGPAVPDDEVALGPTVVAPPDLDEDDDATPEATPAPAPTLPPLPAPVAPPEPVTLLAVGNLGGCDPNSVEVASAIAADSGIIVAVGDLSTDGSQAKIDECFLAQLESELDRVYVVPGDRDLATEDGAAFYDLAARTPTGSAPGEGWFVVSLGGWQIIGLNSRCEALGGCETDTEQFQWLNNVLRDEPVECRAVIWHDARFTSATGEDDATDMSAILARLDGAGTDVLITGSAGNYEQLGPLRPGGALAAGDEHGMRHFNIGGGSGAGFDERLQPGTQVSKDDSNGYVRFVFSPEGYTWEFVATSNDESEPDIGSGSC